MEPMNKSTTNRDSADDPSVRIVSRTSVGQRVLVNGHFGGVLRYLGTVAGKHGLYCGVELDQRVGKNDGTYGGIAYFECPSDHGIFAPTHKVQPELCVDGSSRPTISTTPKGNRKSEWWAKERMASSVPLPPGTSSTVTPPSGASPPFRHSSPSSSPSSSSSASARPPPLVPPLPPMDWSLMSIGSTNSDGSVAAASAAGHFNIFDDSLMANSQVTYTVFDSDCMMLSDLELSDSTVLRFDEDESDGGEEEEEDAFQQQKRMIMMMEEEVEEKRRTFMGSLLDRSVVLDGPTLNLALPVIGSNKMRADGGEGEEETPTPMAEMRRTDDFGRERDEEDRLNRNHLRLEFPRSQELTKSGQLQKIAAQQQQQNANNNNNNTNSTNGVGRGRAEHTAEDGLSVISQQQQQQDNNNRSVAEERREGQRQRGEETHQQQRKETPKRPRAPLFQSVPSANPMRAKCKPPTKSQMIMDQLKASIEAEKQRAKRKKEEEEEKRKKEENEREEREEEEKKEKEEKKKKEKKEKEEKEKKEKEKKEEEEKKKKEKEEKEEEKKERDEEEKKREAKKKQTMDDERREINGKLPTEDFANLTVMEQKVSKVKEVKLRRSMLAQSAQQRPLLPRVNAQNSTKASNQIPLQRSNSRLTSSARPVLSSRENTSIALKSTSQISVMTRRSMTAKSQSVEHVATAQKDLSGISRTTANGRAKEAKSANALDRHRREMENELNMTKQRLKRTTKTLDVFAVVTAHFDRKLDEASTKTTVLNEEAAQHERAIAELESNWKKRLQRAKEEHRVEIDDLRAKISSEHSENIAKIQQQHRKTVKELENYAQQLEKKWTEQEEKHRRELAESATLSTNRLQKELESRNYELQVKNDELFKLRQANRELQFEVDKLPEKEAQIVKLEARIVDWRDEVNRLRQLQKKLIAQREGCLHELNETRAKADAVVKEKEVLEYQLNGQNGGEGSDGQQISTPRTRKSIGTPSVGAATPPTKGFRTPEMQRRRTSQLSASCHHHTNGKSQTPQFDMSRSMDSSMIGQSLIACYIQEGRSKPQNTPTKIYTPRDVLEIPPDLSSNGRRVVNFDSTREDTGEFSRAEGDLEGEEKRNPSL